MSNMYIHASEPTLWQVYCVCASKSNQIS